jgi:hypothetical protein
MFLIAPGAQALARWDDAERERKMGRQIRRGYFTEKFSPEAGHYEYGARIEDAALDFYRQVDAQDSVFA